MNISVIGSGHVGLVTGACFADLGHQVLMVDHDRKKIAALKASKMPFYEPGLEELVHRGVEEDRLRFTTSTAEGVRHGTIIFLCVGTPARPNGEADLTAVEEVVRDVAQAVREYRLIVEKSTVPVQTGEWIARICRGSVRRGVACDVASNPEFLREGQGLQDFLHPDRIVLGVESKRAKELLLALYKPLNAPAVVTDVKSAELIKHASNSFLAMKISFINSVAQICERVGADVMQVAEGMGLDRRIGRAFLDAGVGYGGYWFSKDRGAVLRIAEKLGIDFQLLKATARVNAEQRQRLVKRVEEALWNLNRKTIAVLGISFKPDTDDLRDAPSIDIIRSLRQEGAVIRAFDPQAMAQAKALLPGVTFCKSAYEAVRGADCLILMTEWNEFKELEFARIKKLMRQPLVVDGRNLYQPKTLQQLGFRYIGVGRGEPWDQR